MRGVSFLLTVACLLLPYGRPDVLADTEGIGRRYFGQEPPSDTAEVFAPGIISDAGYRLHGVPAFSPDGARAYWPVIPPALICTELTDSGWSTPAPADLPGRGVGSPVFSYDGARLYYQALLPEGRGSLDLWYVDLTGDTTHAPVNLGSPPNSESLESQPSFTTTGDLYFSGSLDSVGMNRGIYVSRREGGALTTPKLLNSHINTRGIDYTPFVSPNGDYLLFSSSRPTSEESDLKLYVSFVDADGDWQKPRNLSAALGWTDPARFPALTPDGRYLFFLSRGRIYWVSAEVIERLR
jgi:hypothetical protein